MNSMTATQQRRSIAALQRAIDDHFEGNKAEFARQIEANRRQIYQWIAGDVAISLQHSKNVERATGGDVTWRHLRPDVAQILDA